MVQQPGGIFDLTGRKALVTYLVAGDPNPEASVPAMHALVRGGVDKRFD